MHIDEDAKESLGKIVGAAGEEVTIMQSLTANLHFLMASFYRPTKERSKIIIEGKAFPSDHVRSLALVEGLNQVLTFDVAVCS